MNIKNTFSCACSGGAGIAAGHIGCLVAPFTAAVLPVMAGPVTSTLLTLAGLGAWWGLSGRFSSVTQRGFVFAGALAGLVTMNVVHGTAKHEAAFLEGPICRTPLP